MKCAVLTLVIVLAANPVILANEVDFGGYSGDFANGGLWWDGTAGTNHAPGSSDTAVIFTGAVPTVGASDNCTVGQLYVGEWCRTGLPNNSVQSMIINGSLTALQTSTIGCLATSSPTERGNLTINSGGSFSVSQGLIIGAGNNGTVTVNGGSLFASWAIGLGYNPWGGDNGGVGTIYINGGSVESNQLLYESTNDGSQIVMSGGSLKIWIYNQGIAGMSSNHIVAAAGKTLQYTSYAAPGGTGIIITAIPEPATMVLLGLGGLLFARRK